jgi:hypothetical protein
MRPSTNCQPYANVLYMSQRHSEYPIRDRWDYPTPPWVTRVLIPYLPKRIRYIWEPAPGGGKIVRALRAEGYTVFGNRRDFLKCEELPDPRVQAIITNPPYGGGGHLGRLFIEHALAFNTATTYMLLRVDFDSARTRQHLFGQCSGFAGKIVLLNRIDWWKGPASSSTNHAWFVWSRTHKGPPIIHYAERS